MTQPCYDNLEPITQWNPGNRVPMPFGEGSCTEGAGWEIEEIKGTFCFDALEESIGEMLFSLRKWPFCFAPKDDNDEISLTITDFVIVEVVTLPDALKKPAGTKRWTCAPSDWE